MDGGWVAEHELWCSAKPAPPPHSRKTWLFLLVLVLDQRVSSASTSTVSLSTSTIESQNAQDQIERCELGSGADVELVTQDG
jgi:hypothetical protein